MKRLKLLISGAFLLGMAVSAPLAARAADFSISTAAPQVYYASTSYEDVYDLPYNYGGVNLVDFQDAVLLYGNPSTTRIGMMEKVCLPQETVGVVAGGDYGISGGDLYIAPGLEAADSSAYTQPAYTSVDGMTRSDGSIGTVTIPALSISMKVWEGETATSMAKGMGHYASTSAWDGNVGVCGHNRGSRYVIGSIKDLKAGDIITYTTVYGTRTYAVSYVGTISNTDWSWLQSTTDNRITFTTCLANHPESRVCVQAVEISG